MTDPVNLTVTSWQPRQDDSDDLTYSVISALADATEPLKDFAEAKSGGEGTGRGVCDETRYKS